MSLSGCLFSAFDKFRLQFDDFVFGKTCYSNNVFDWIVADKHCLGVVFLPLQVRPLFLVKHVRHSVNLVQKRFVGIPFQRYIFSEVLVKKSLQLFGGNLFFFKNIAEYAQHFCPVGCFAVFQGSAVVNSEELLDFNKIDIQFVIEHVPVAHELSVVQVGVPFERKLVLGQQRKYIDVRQVVVLRLLDGARNYAGCVVDKPVNKKRVKGLLNFNKNGVARLGKAIDVENGGLVVQNTGIFRHTQGKRLDCISAKKHEHCVQKLHRAFGLGLVGQEHLEDAVAERVNVLVSLAVFSQMFGMLVDILYHGEKVTTVHKFVPIISLTNKSTNENPEFCKHLFAKSCKKFFAGTPCMNYREAA